LQRDCGDNRGNGTDFLVSFGFGRPEQNSRGHKLEMLKAKASRLDVFLTQNEQRHVEGLIIDAWREPRLGEVRDPQAFMDGKVVDEGPGSHSHESSKVRPVISEYSIKQSSYF